MQAEKSADGLKSLEWFKAGEIDKVVTYCKKDVELTRDLFLHGLNHGYLLFETKDGHLVRLPTPWKLSALKEGKWEE